MDHWDTPLSKPKLKGSGEVPLCDLKAKPTLHRIGSLFYFSFYRRTKKGVAFDEIKKSVQFANEFANNVNFFIGNIISLDDDFAIVTTPRRRNFGGFHFSTEVCREISEFLHFPFYENALQCINRSRICPEFHLLRPIHEKRIILFDDIITTGSTLSAGVEALGERDLILNLIGINNR